MAEFVFDIAYQFARQDPMPLPIINDYRADVAAARGAALLDREMPGWEKKINTDTLNILFPMRCILGQVYGGFQGYAAGLRALKMTDESGQIIDGNAIINHGFSPCGLSLERQHEINGAWLAEIANRLCRKDDDVAREHGPQPERTLDAVLV